MALDLGVEISIRMNIDRVNITQLPTLADEFHSRGWMKYSNFRSYVAPITTSETGHVDPKKVFNTWQLGRAMEELKQSHPLLANVEITDDSLQARARQIFDGKSSAKGFNSSFCGAHTTMYVIDAFADLYACWERTGDPNLRIGHIDENGDVLMNRDLLEMWRGRNVVSNSVCRKCRYATSCGGGCAALAEHASGDTYRNFCDGYASRFRASVAKAYLEFLRGERREVRIERLCEA